MKLSKHKRNTDASMNMTPMIDIVFLLIIFFMTVSQISRINEEPIELAQIRPTGTEDIEPTVVTINIDRSGEIIISGTTRSIADTIVAVVNEMATVGNEPSLIKVLIRTHRFARSETVNELVTQLNELGIVQIRLAAVEIES